MSPGNHLIIDYNDIYIVEPDLSIGDDPQKWADPDLPVNDLWLKFANSTNTLNTLSYY